MKIITVEGGGGITPGNPLVPVATRQTSVTDTTQESLARMDQTLARTEEILRSSTSAQTSARANAASSQANSAGNFIQRGAEVGAQLLGRFVDIQQTELQRKQQELEKARIAEEARRKQEEALREQRSQEAYAAAQDEAQAIILQQPTDGTMVTMERLNALRQKYPDLTNEQYAKLKGATFNDVQNNDTNAIRRITDSQEDYRREARKGAEVSVKAAITPYLAQLKYEKDPAQQALLIQKIDGEIGNAAREGKLDTLDILMLRNSVLADAIDRTQGNADTQALLNDGLSQSRSAWTELQTLEDKKVNGELTEQEYRLAKQDVLNRYPNAKVDQFLTPEDAQRLSYDQQKLALGIKQLQQEGYEFNNQVATIENQDLAEQALAVLNDPSLRVNFEVLKTGDNKRVLELADTLEPIRKRLLDPNRRVQLSNLNKTVQTKTAELNQIQQYAANPEQYLLMKEKGLSVPADISPERQQQVIAEINAAQEQYGVLVRTYQQDSAILAQYGIVYDDNSGRLGLNQSVAEERGKAKSTAPPPQTQGSAPPAASGLPAGFSPGWGGLPSPAPAKQTPTGAQGTQGKAKFVAPLREVFTAHLYDETPGGSWDFTFIDNQGRDITTIPSPVTGVVTEAGTRGGYGNVVAVRDEATGREWFMAHLDAPAYYKVGQRVTAGAPLAKQGTSGNSTGPHIHLEVYDKPYSQGGQRLTDRRTVEPWVREYFARATSGNWPQTAPRGVGLPPTQAPNIIVSQYKLEAPINAPPGSIILPGGAYLFGGEVVFPKMKQVSGNSGVKAPSTNVLSTARPLPNGRMSVARGDYPAKNDPTANYGYDSLAKDKAFAQALAGTADRLNIPAQWLADIMAVESNQGFMHNPAARNSEGAVGLIQFYPGGGLADVAQEMGVTEDEASRRLLGMTRAQQMRWVEFYLKRQLQYVGRSSYDRMEDVFAAIWGGSSMLGAALDRRGGSDSNVDYGGYLNLIGSHAGRAYNHHLLRGGTPTHSAYVSGCPTCERMHKSGRVVPHAAPN